MNISIEIPQGFRVTEKQFELLAFCNQDVRLEKSSDGELIIMPPTGSDTGNKNVELATEFVIWNRKTKLGYVFDSSTGFTLPNGAVRSPDVSWIEKFRWERLTPTEKQKFATICPDFVLELRSPSDDIETLRKKMIEYQDNGARLGWLLNLQEEEVEITRAEVNQPQIFKFPLKLSGEEVLPGFILDSDLLV